MILNQFAEFPLLKPAAHKSNFAELTASRGSKFLLCADSFREDLTSPGLEENIYRVLYFSPREEKISTSTADVASLVLSCLNQLASESISQLANVCGENA